MKFVSVIYAISYILATLVCSYSTHECPTDIEVCKCISLSQGLYYKCEDFENISQVQIIIEMSPSVKEVEIINRNSSELPSDIFQHVCLEKLYIDLPQINITASLFENQSECLQLLHLKSGITEEFSIEPLLSLINLKSLVFVENRISELKEPFWKLNLTNIGLQNNNIIRIYSAVFPRTLTTLSLKDNRLVSLNNSLSFLTNLFQLIISNNRIETLNGELISLRNLILLIAKNNRIRSLNNSLHNLSKLIVLDLSENGICSIGDSLTNLRNLKRLHLSYNLLTELSDTDFQFLAKLNYLDLAYNQINSLGNSLIPLKNLKQLHLEGNRLIEIVGSFVCLNKLTKLNLSGNLLQNLKFLNIEEQQESCHFRKHQLDTIYLIGNPLQCTDNLLSIISNLTVAEVTIFGNPCEMINETSLTF